MVDETASSMNPPVACTLAGDNFRKRLAWIAELTRDALQGYERDDLVLKLQYTRDAAGRVREMVSKEKECCAFLDFDLREEQNQIRLTITANEDARGAADMLFQQFVASPSSANATSSSNGPVKKEICPL